MRGKMTPRIAALIAAGWVVLGCAQLWDGQQDPLNNRHFWFGILGLLLAMMYAYRWKKLSDAAKEEQGKGR